MSCSARAVLLLIILLHDLVGMVLLSLTEAKSSILRVDSCRCLTWFDVDPSFLTMWSSCLVRMLFCSSCSSIWWAIVAFRRARTGAWSAAGGGEGLVPRSLGDAGSVAFEMEAF